MAQIDPLLSLAFMKTGRLRRRRDGANC